MGDGNTGAVCNVLQKLSDSDFQNPLKTNHLMLKAAATRLKYLQGSFSTEGVMDEADFEAYLKEHKALILDQAKKNVLRNRKVKYFVNSVKQVEQSVRTNGVSTQQSYQQQIDSFMGPSEDEIDIEQEDTYRDILTILGEYKQQNADEDIEVVQNTASTQPYLKCPITAMYMVDAVRNKVCGHVYSRAGIEAHLRNNRKCPVAGCNNTNVTLSQLEDDLETQQNVRKEKRRLDQQSQILASQSTSLVDTDDEEEEGNF